jgi:hypothetical protein
MRRRRFYEKLSDRTSREKTEAIRRLRKLARKRAIRDGLIAAPARKPAANGKNGTGSCANALDRGKASGCDRALKSDPVVGSVGDGADAFDHYRHAPLRMRRRAYCKPDPIPSS